MNNATKYFFKSLPIFALFLGTISCSRELNISFSETVKMSLRDVGHHLLLTNQDSTSLVKPVVAIEPLKYQLSFEKQLIIHPDSLIAFIKNSFQKANIYQDYVVEVLQCADKEVAYSYKMKQNIENAFIACRSRQLHKGCYTITIRFTKALIEEGTRDTKLISILLLSIFIVITIAFIFYKKKSKTILEDHKEKYKSIGKYKFYPEQNKLIKEATEIGLSKKECELLSIFIANPNQVVKRDELTKKVWADNGVIVGRSLDTYISKLRKKLQEDPSIKLTNIHGVGYRLEVEL